MFSIGFGFPYFENGILHVIELSFSIILCTIFVFFAIWALSEGTIVAYYQTRFLDMIEGGGSRVTEFKNTEHSLVRFSELIPHPRQLKLHKGNGIRSIRNSDQYCLRCISYLDNQSKTIVFEKGVWCHHCHLKEKLYCLFLYRLALEVYSHILPTDIRKEVLYLLHQSAIDQIISPPICKSFPEMPFPNEYFQFCQRIPLEMDFRDGYYIFYWNSKMTLSIHSQTGHTIRSRKGKEKETFVNYHEAFKFLLK